MDLPLLLGTVLLRPYVFIFLFVYFIGCSAHLGFKKAVLFCIAGYWLTWLSEYSSIHNGFPYGYYYYLEHTKNRELWVMGVPFMDSISYVFLAYASYATALAVLSPSRPHGKTLFTSDASTTRDSLSVRVLAAVLMVFLDVIIDPVALRGDRWFLGKLYGYPKEGIYFGIPLSNFAGWLLVSFILIYTLQKIDKHLGGRKAGGHGHHDFPAVQMVGPALYAAVLIFNLSVTFSIGESRLGWTGLLLVISSFIVLCFIRMKSSARAVVTSGREPGKI